MRDQVKQLAIKVRDLGRVGPRLNVCRSSGVVVGGWHQEEPLGQRTAKHNSKFVQDYGF